jgi:hypothetical protein
MKPDKTKQERLRHVLFAAVLLMSAFSGGALAKYLNASEKLTNIFSKDAYDTPEIKDTVSPDTGGDTENKLYSKSNVTVTIGAHTYPVYVRVHLVITWQDDENKVYYQAPVCGEDYSLTYDTGNWMYDSNSGYYYYKKAVASKDTISFMTSEQQLKQLTTAPTGYTMHVEVLTETIQAIGITDENDSKTAVMDAWNIQPDNSDAS